MKLTDRILLAVVLLAAAYLYGFVRAEAAYYKGLHSGYVEAAMAKVKR